MAMTMEDWGSTCFQYESPTINMIMKDQWRHDSQRGLEDFNFKFIKYESPMATDYDGWLQWAMEDFSSACMYSQNDSNPNCPSLLKHNQ